MYCTANGSFEPKSPITRLPRTVAFNAIVEIKRARLVRGPAWFAG